MTEYIRGEPSLFDAKARRDDPFTSHLAANRVTKSGRLNEMGRKVLDVLRQHDGATANELHYYMRDAEKAHRVLRNLERSGYVKEGEPRICRRRGTKALTWFILEG